jgi:prepilin-type N-terminal cleavage/methylation domain-containing protein
MLQNIKKRTEGFTIIEVLIVLAIAGLIMLIVFLAVPALQRNNRNTQRKNDAGRALSAVQEIVNNNSGVAPVSAAAPAVLNGFSQLQNVNYNIHASSFQAIPNPMGNTTMYIRNFSVCAASPTGTGQIATAGGNARQITISYLVETPGSTASGIVPADNTPQCSSIQ